MIGVFFDTIREEFAHVAKHATHVRIRYDKIEAYAASLPDEPLVTELGTEWHFIGTPEETAAYVIILDSINFGSGYEPVLDNLKDGSIYKTISTSLKAYFETYGMLTAKELQTMTPQRCGDLFDLDEKSEFIGLCCDALHEIGDFIADRYHGDYMAFVKSADGLAENLIQELLSLKGFQDQAVYQGKIVHILKRAQIMAADLHFAFRHYNTELFQDIDSLTMFADNAVPGILHHDGILAYQDDLLARITAGQTIGAGTDEEIELRACAAHAVELIKQHKSLSSVEIDHILWHRHADDPSYKNALMHRTLTNFY